MALNSESTALLSPALSGPSYYTFDGESRAAEESPAGSPCILEIHRAVGDALIKAHKERRQPGEELEVQRRRRNSCIAWTCLAVMIVTLVWLHFALKGF